MMTQPEVGPNDIVIHLVNPYRCGDCGLEFCLRSLLLEHLLEHIEKLKSESPCHQIVCYTSIIEQMPNCLTVTRDILQINEQQVFELQDMSLDYSQLTPLKLLEQAGILNLPEPGSASRPVQYKPLIKENQGGMQADAVCTGRKVSLLKYSQPLVHEMQSQDVPALTTSTYTNTNKNSFQDTTEPDAAQQAQPDTAHQAIFVEEKYKREFVIKIESPAQLGSVQSVRQDSQVAHLDSVQAITDAVRQDSQAAHLGSVQAITDAVRQDSQVAHLDLVQAITDAVRKDSQAATLEERQSPGRAEMKGSGARKGVVCLICCREFVNTSVLERHQVVHTGARPYSCSICFKEFNDVSSHRKHLLIHKRQHRCPVCHSMYLRRTQLLLHMKQHSKKRFLQFGNSFHEVQVNVTRNDEGQLVQEYSLLILEGNKQQVSADSTQTEYQLSYNTDVVMEEKQDCPDTGVTADVAQDAVVCDMPQEEEQKETGHKKKIIYRCGHCKKVILTRPTLSRHLIKHTNTRPFQCDLCLKYFRDKADLLHHGKTHTKPVQCQTCLSSFSKVLYLQNHLLKGCPATDKDARFTVLSDLRCQCNICNKILKNKANVLRHFRVHAFQQRTHSKADTSITLANIDQISQNVEDHFKPLFNSVGFHCLICGQEFRFKSFMVTHVRMHLNQRPFQCPHCPKSFYARLMLKKHQHNHTRPYNCPVCNKSFIRRYLMKQHFKKSHEQEGPLKDVTELVEQKLIQCDLCGKIMKSCHKSLMLGHIRMHKDIRPYTCNTCHKSFISDNALRKHAHNHTKPYKCQLCGAGFSRRYLLTDHFRKKCARHKMGTLTENSGPLTAGVMENSGPPSTGNSETVETPYRLDHEDSATDGPPTGLGHVDSATEDPPTGLGHVDSATNGPPTGLSHEDSATEDPPTGLGHVDSATEGPPTELSHEDSSNPTALATSQDRPFEAKIVTEHDYLTGSTTYGCQPCDKKFTQYESLMRHMSTFSRPTLCKYCQHMFPDKHLAMAHQRSCLGPSLGSCLGSSLGTIHKVSRQTRVAGQQQEKVQRIMKEMIQKIGNLTSSSDKTKTLQRKTEDMKTSGTKTVSQANPERVFVKVKTEASPVQAVSKEVARTLCAFKEEMGKFKCPECERSFATPRNLKIHASIHVRLFKCQVCDLDFSQISHLRAHSKTHKTEPEAEDDSPTSSSRVKLQREDNTRPGVGPGVRPGVQVTRADRKRSRTGEHQPELVAEHVSQVRPDHTHSDETRGPLMQAGTRGRPYSCRMCRRRFTDQLGLDGHMVHNHGVKVY